MKKGERTSLMRDLSYSALKEKSRSNVNVQSDPSDWQKRMADCKAEFDNNYNSNAVSDATLQDFEILKIIGKGTFGIVVIAKAVPSKEYFAIKVLEKKIAVEKNQVNMLRNEKRLMMALRWPFVVHMEKFFKDNMYLYFVMPFIAGGNMFSVIEKNGKLSEPAAMFYAAQVVLAFEYLHVLKIAYRDLKLENILLDPTGYVKLTDFGLAKIILKRTYTFCGTPVYIAPEVILRRGYDHAVDWWALGVLIYEMCSGTPPFCSKDITGVYESIVNRTFLCPSSFSRELKSIIDDLFQVDSSRRLGNFSSGVTGIKNHPWFWNISWQDVFNMKMRPPYIPTILFDGDTSNFTDYGRLHLKQCTNDMCQDLFNDF